MNRIVRTDLVDRVKPILERTGMFKLPLGDPYLEAEERETYPQLIPEIIEPWIRAAMACYLFPPPSGIAPHYWSFFERPASGRGPFTLKPGSAEQLAEEQSFWYLSSEQRGEFCFVLPREVARRDVLYTNAYMPTGFTNIGTVLSRRAIDFGRKQVGDGSQLCAFYSEVGYHNRSLFVFGAKERITDEWIRALERGRCDQRMWPLFFSNPAE